MFLLVAQRFGRYCRLSSSAGFYTTIDLTAGLLNKWRFDSIPALHRRRLLRQRDSDWESLPGPPGPVRSLAVVGDVAYAVAPDSGGVDRVWRAQP